MSVSFKMTNNFKNVQYTCDQNEISMLKVNPSTGFFEKSTFSVGAECYNSILGILNTYSDDKTKANDLILNQIENTIEEVSAIIKDYDKIKTTSDIESMSKEVKNKSKIDIFYVSETQLLGIELKSEKNYASKQFYTVLENKTDTPLELVSKIVTFSKSIVPENMINRISIKDSKTELVYEYACKNDKLKAGFSSEITASEDDRKNFLNIMFDYQEKRVDSPSIPYKYSFENNTLKDINLGVCIDNKINLDELLKNSKDEKCEISICVDEELDLEDLTF